MKKILMFLSFIVVSAMCDTNYIIEESKIEKHLSQKERFKMLFGKTIFQFNEIRQARVNRNLRNSRKIDVSKLLSDNKVLGRNSLTQDERYEILFGNRIPTARVARKSRFIFPRQSRDCIYISFNF